MGVDNLENYTEEEIVDSLLDVVSQLEYILHKHRMVSVQFSCDP